MKTYEELKKVVDEFIILTRDAIKTHPFYVPIAMHEFARNLYPYDYWLPFPKRKDSSSHTERIFEVTTNLCKYLKFNTSFPSYKSNFKQNLVLEKYQASNKIEDVYGDLWGNLQVSEIVKQTQEQLNGILETNDYSLKIFKGKKVLDIGCGFGRYSIAISSMGAKSVIGVDIGKKGLEVGEKIAKANNFKNIKFDKQDLLSLPYSDESFDIVFCYGVLHHLESIEKGLEQIYRILNNNGMALIYVYGSGGIYWYSRKLINKVMKELPRKYCQEILDMYCVPRNRWSLIDNWYVPIEKHSKNHEIVDKLKKIGFSKIERLNNAPIEDLNYYAKNIQEEGSIVWGEGILRYMLTK